MLTQRLQRVVEVSNLSNNLSVPINGSTIIKVELEIRSKSISEKKLNGLIGYENELDFPDFLSQSFSILIHLR